MDGGRRVGASGDAHRAFAEEVVVDESPLAVVPGSLSLDVASLLSCGVLTGVGAALDRVAIKPGASVVVVGTGGVGLNVVQAAALAGAGTVVAVDVSPAKHTVAAAFGATHDLDPTNGIRLPSCAASRRDAAPTSSSSPSAGPT